MTGRLATLLAMLLAGIANASTFEARVLPPPAAPGKDVAPFVAAPAGFIALTHVRVIDGTGAAPKADETLVIQDGKISAVQRSSVPLPKGARVLDLSGDSVLPGLIGMHDHCSTSPGRTSRRKAASMRPLLCRRWPTRRRGCTSPAASPRFARLAASSPTPI